MDPTPGERAAEVARKTRPRLQYLVANEGFNKNEQIALVYEGVCHDQTRQSAVHGQGSHDPYSKATRGNIDVAINLFKNPVNVSAGAPVRVGLN
jgi:hypothetical protein